MGLNCAPLNIYVEELILNETVVRDWVFKEVIRLNEIIEAGLFLLDLCPDEKRKRNQSSLFSPDTQRKGHVRK